jgi:hypothetical protein
MSLEHLGRSLERFGAELEQLEQQRRHLIHNRDVKEQVCRNGRRELDHLYTALCAPELGYQRSAPQPTRQNRQ